jgi:hypothetical protein
MYSVMLFPLGKTTRAVAAWGRRAALETLADVRAA